MAESCELRIKGAPSGPESANTNVSNSSATLESTYNRVYAKNRGWNCMDWSFMTTSDGYIGQVSVYDCRLACDQTSWCVGFDYSFCQGKCWVRAHGIKCTAPNPMRGETTCFDYYGKIQTTGPYEGINY